MLNRWSGKQRELGRSIIRRGKIDKRIITLYNEADKYCIGKSSCSGPDQIEKILEIHIKIIICNDPRIRVWYKAVRIRLDAVYGRQSFSCRPDCVIIRQFLI